MLAKRIIPCLDVDAGRVVKGVRFTDFRDAGDIAEQARTYDLAGADELVFLDITASADKRDLRRDWVVRASEVLTIPFTVGGGIRTVQDMTRTLADGADKVSINTAAVKRPEVIDEGAREFGSQNLVVAIDAKRRDSKSAARGWEVFIDDGRTPTGRDLMEWVREAEQRGAGELLLTSMDRDGTHDGYDLEMLGEIAGRVNIPVIASGGVGTLEHLYEGLNAGADAVLAASIFHFGTYTIGQAKDYLKGKGVHVRT